MQNSRLRTKILQGIIYWLKFCRYSSAVIYSYISIYTKGDIMPTPILDAYWIMAYQILRIDSLPRKPLDSFFWWIIPDRGISWALQLILRRSLIHNSVSLNSRRKPLSMIRSHRTRKVIKLYLVLYKFICPIFNAKLIKIEILLYIQMSNNPFSLETDKKKFFTEVVTSQNDQKQANLAQILSGTSNANRFKNMNEELEKLAKKKQEMLYKEEQLNYIFKKQKPSSSGNLQLTNQQNDKKFRVRALLKQKRESVNQFLNKKKQIYLANMNINIKKEQTRKLAESIKDQEETLKARQLYFQNDVQFMQKFILGIKKQADDAQNAVEAQLKHQEQLVSRINGLEAQIQKMDNLISKNKQILDSLQLYKKFIERFYDPDRKWKQYVPKVTEDVLFMTEGGANIPKDPNDGFSFLIQYEPQNMLEIFVDAQEANIRQIQNLQDKEEELDHVVNLEKKQNSFLQAVIAENQQRIQELHKKCLKKQAEHDQFRVMARSNTNKINILEDENLDIEKLCTKLFQIYQEINPKRAEQLQVADKVNEMKREAAELQEDVQKIRISILHSKENYPHLIEHVEKDFKNKIKRENLEKKLEENRKMELKKQQQQEKKRNQMNNTKAKGRKDMQKIVLKKKVKIEKKDDGDKGDDDIKYLEGDH